MCFSKCKNMGTIDEEHFCWVQAQAQSQAQAAARDRADVARSPQDAAEAWRRHIYVEGLYAQPMGVFLPQYV